MTDCEICGKKATMKVNIDGVVLDVCDECANLGEPVSLSVTRSKRSIPEPEELSLYIDPDFQRIIRKAREKMGLNIKDLAREIKEKESIISRVESGKLKPTIDLARKLEKFLRIKLLLRDE